jgi:hypothetical protein
MRVGQQECRKGSQKWIQRAVNRPPGVLDSLILARLPEARQITWRSPLVHDEYAEYRDAHFLSLVGAERLAPELAKFWPEGGPRWDGLAVAGKHNILLVEAKAHIEELFSPPTDASPLSRKKIENSLRETISYIGAKPRAERPPA